MAQAKKEKVRNIGVGIEAPKETCNDAKCPFHGSVPVRGKTFIGKVVKAKMDKSVVIEWDRRIFVPKYERYEKRRTRIKSHNPPCIDAKEGQTVKVMETRPLSKTITTTVVAVVENKQD